jgi:3-methyladenine DNA glycosylase AlkC
MEHKKNLKIKILMFNKMKMINLQISKDKEFFKRKNKAKRKNQIKFQFNDILFQLFHTILTKIIYNVHIESILILVGFYLYF